MDKKKRRYAAVTLAIAGVAGLSLAAAAQLEVRTAPEIAIGSGTFSACDSDGVDVSYTYGRAGDNFVIDTVTVANIATECAGQPISVFITGVDPNEELFSVSDTLDGSTSFTSSALDKAIPIATDLEQATVIIGGAKLP